jgi:beta-mannosidase
VTLVVGDIRMPLVVTAVGDGEVHASGTAHLAQVERWWPHTHGDQPRRRVVVSIDGEDHDLGSVGFRTVTARTDDGAFGLELNGVPIFCRGACWVPVDPIALAAAPAAQREALVQMRDAGMNMVRVGGTMVYEDDVFYETCDELGILVWQDAMFANMDPPDDEPFLSSVELEIAQLLRRLGARPSLAVFCGGSEIEQQASMLGLPEDKRAIPLLTTTFPALRDRYAPGVPYVSSTPTGGGLPIHTDTGISHYFGVGAYQRPLDDARRAEVRFAAECLAFANVPEPDTVDDAFGAAAGPGHNPEWKRRVPRDNGTGWDFEDVRDHYVAALFGVEPRVVRYADPERYLDLGRAAVAEVMTATFAEWRRPGSPCDGALVWWQRDLWDGAGWGLVDARGVPKSAWWALRRALAPVAVLVTDEGLNGLDVHVFNDRAEPLAAILRVELFGRGELLLERTETKVDVSGRAATTVRGDSLFDGFRDLTWAYRFGPSNHDVVAVTLLGTDGSVLGQAVHLPLGWGRPVEADLGLQATLERRGDTWGLTVGSRRFAQSVRVESPRHNASDSWFHLPPGNERTIVLEPHGPDQPAPKGTVRALNSALVVHFDGDQ